MTDQLMPKEEFWKKLQDARTPSHSGGHPFSNAWKKGEVTKDQLGFWAMQQYYYIEEVTQMFAALFMRLPDLDARLHMLENLNGEEFPERHPDLLLDFAEACGYSRDRVKAGYLNGEILPSTVAMRSWTYELASIRPLSDAAAGIMVALEGQTPTIYPHYIEAGRKMGFTDKDLKFFHVHIEADEGHEEHGLNICTRYATTRDLQERAIATVGMSARMRYRMLDGVYDATIGAAQKQAAE
jgi:pyrroloquinoline-quinone synthase